MWRKENKTQWSFLIHLLFAERMNDPFAPPYSILKMCPALVGHPWNFFIYCGLYCPRSYPCNTEIRGRRNSFKWPLQLAHNSKKQSSYTVFCWMTMKTPFFRKKGREESPGTGVLLLATNLEDPSPRDDTAHPVRAALGCHRTSLPQSSAGIPQLSTKRNSGWWWHIHINL